MTRKSARRLAALVSLQSEARGDYEAGGEADPEAAAEGRAEERESLEAIFDEGAAGGVMAMLIC